MMTVRAGLRGLKVRFSLATGPNAEEKDTISKKGNYFQNKSKFHYSSSVTKIKLEKKKKKPIILFECRFLEPLLI